MIFALDILLLFFLELMEASLIKAKTFGEFAEFVQNLWQKPLFFIFMHSSLIFLIFFIFSNHITNIWVLLVLVLKTLDLALKIRLIYTNKPPKELQDLQINNFIKFAGLTYPPTIFLALN